MLGDIDDDEELLDWLTDPINMELTEHIEKVNRKMFKKIRQTSDYVAVFFCKYRRMKMDEYYGGGINKVIWSPSWENCAVYHYVRIMIVSNVNMMALHISSRLITARLGMTSHP